VKRNLLLKSALALAIASPLMAAAESQLTTGSGSAQARLNFEVNIPAVLFLAVGSGAGQLVTNSAIDTVFFDYTNNAADVGTGAPAQLISNSINGSGSTVPVRVFGNNGQLVITANNPANLVSGTDTIPFSQLTVSSNNPALPAPAFSGGTSQPTVNGRVTDLNAEFTYGFSNNLPVAPAAGVYTGTVTYTAAVL